MSSPSIFEPAAEPPKPQRRGRVAVAPSTRVLVAIGRQRRIRRYGRLIPGPRWRNRLGNRWRLIAGRDRPGAASASEQLPLSDPGRGWDSYDQFLLDRGLFANANPSVQLDLETLAGAVPPFPPSVPGQSQSALVELPSDHPSARAEAWAAAIADEVAAVGVDNLVIQVRALACGFVSAGRRTRLALICYVTRRGLVQPARLAIRVQGETFPIVLRPLPRDQVACGDDGFLNGQVTARARLDEHVGMLTAAHVLAADGQSTGVAAGERVDCQDPGCPSHLVARADPVMDAAFVVDGPATGHESLTRATATAGYFPVEVRTPDGQLAPGRVVEIPLPEGLIPGTFGKPALAAARLYITLTGEPGWSGGLVCETVYRELYGGEPRPYAMFLGPTQLYTALVGRVNLLAQLEKVWGIELVEAP